MKVKFSNFLIVALLPVFCAVSFSLLYFYDAGDQIHYTRFYTALSNASYHSVMDLAKAYVDSSEPISAYLLWFGATVGIDKYIYISALNVLLLTLFTAFLLRYKVHGFIIFLLLTNFYLLVLLTSAERLKIVYIVLMLAVFFNGRSKILLLLMSPLAHLQSLIFLLMVALYKYFTIGLQKLFSLKVKKSAFYAFIVLSFFFLFLLFIMADGIEKKAQSYISLDFGVLSLFQVMVLFVSSFLLFKDKVAIVVVFLFSAALVLILGGERVNMIFFTAVIYIMITEDKLCYFKIDNIPIIAVLCYLSFKSIGYVTNIIFHGDGFFSG